MELWKTRRREILAGGIVLLVIAAVCYFLPAREQPRAAEDIAVMRISEVLAAHPSYARLMELRAEEATLALAVRDVPEVFSLTPPAADDAPFQDSVWQKNAQTVIGARVELDRERKRLTEVYRKQTEDDYERRKKQIDDEYQNAITNINLKIDNQRAMHGPRVSEDELAQERAGLEAQREALRQERGARQAELYRTWQEEIRARVAARIEPQQATWTAKAKATIDAQKAEADRQKAEAEERNAAAMERAAKELWSRFGAPVLLKGGHDKTRADDYLYLGSEGGMWLRAERIATENTHGTGCTLSSAIAAQLAKGAALTEAVTRAKAYVRGALLSGLSLGKGSGPLDHGWNLEEKQ